MNTSTSQDNPLKEPSLMEQEINQTRERIGRTVEQLEQRLSPGQLVDEALGFARDHGGQFASSVASSVRRNPLPLIVTGMGLMWLLKSKSSTASQDTTRRVYSPYDDDFDGSGTSVWTDSRSAGSGDSGGGVRARVAERLTGVGEAIKSRVAGVRSSVSSAGESIGETVRSTREQVAGRSNDALGSARSTTQAMRERVSGATVTAREQARRARSEFSTLMEEQPLLMGAIGIAIGATIAALVPSTRRERDMLGRASDTVADKASELASEGYESLRETATQSVNELTSSLGKETPSAGTSKSDSGSGSSWDSSSKSQSGRDPLSAGMGKTDAGSTGAGLGSSSRSTPTRSAY